MLTVGSGEPETADLNATPTHSVPGTESNGKAERVRADGDETA